MSLAELIAQIKLNSEFAKTLLGMNLPAFNALLTEFSSHKGKDKTRKYRDEEKLIILILQARFQLRSVDIEALFFTGSPKASSSFLTSAPKRLKNALSKTGQRIAVLTRPRYLSPAYENLADLVSSATLSCTMQGLIHTRIRASADQQALAGFLLRPLRLKSKIGEDNYNQLIQCFLRDMMDTNITTHQSALVLTTMLHLFMHNASHAPRPGFGKAQTREALKQQYYFRSQGNHPHADFLKQITGHSSKQQCIFSRNSALQSIMCEENNIEVGSKNRFFSRLKQYDAEGYPIANASARDTSYFPTIFAHSGLRTNNFTQYFVKLYELLHTNKEDAFRHLLHLNYIARPKKRIPFCNNAMIDRRIQHLEGLFAALPLVDEMKPKVISSLHQERNQQAVAFAASFDPLELSKMQVCANAYSSCLFIAFYPDVTTPDNDNYKEGVTNVLIGFLSGLINHYLCAAGLETHTQRRQSFGMLRTTTTDLGKLKARLSLGIETPSFFICLKKAIAAFDALLQQFDFTQPNCPILKAGFKAAEEPRHKKPTANDGNFFRKAMRSPFKQANAVNAAEHFLKIHPNRSAAFKAYLRAIIDDELSSTLELIAPSTVETALATRHISLLNLLANTRLETIRRVNKLARTSTNQLFKFTYYHVLVKLFGYCEKAQALLSSAETFPASHVYALALHLFEHLSEYLIQLECLKQVLPDAKNQSIRKLQQLESQRVCGQLGVEELQCRVYFTDSGQSANTAALYVLCMQFYPTNQKSSLADKIFMDSGCYYELQDFFREELGFKLTDDLTAANIVYCDITSLQESSAERFNQDNVNVIVLDITHQPLLNEPTANDFIRTMLENNKWVVLTSSMLKHEQAGLDKFQAGKLIFLTPEGENLNLDVMDSLENIMEQGFNPMVAGILRMLNKVGGEHLEEIAAPRIGI